MLHKHDYLLDKIYKKYFYHQAKFYGTLLSGTRIDELLKSDLGKIQNNEDHTVCVFTHTG